MRRFKAWCDRHNLDWFGLLIGVAFFASLLVMR